MRICVDVEAGTVAVGDEVFRGQWVVFYALLALRALDGGAHANVDAGLLHEYAPWSHKTVASAGKEVARHLAELARRNVGAAVVSERRTRAWRLGINAAELRPSPSAVAAWCQGRAAGHAEHVLERVRVLVLAEIAFQDGRLDDATVEVDGDDRLARWELAMAARNAQRAEDADALDVLAARCSGWVDDLGRAVRRRMAAWSALAARFDDAEAMLARLRRELDRVPSGSDSATSAVLDNIRAVLLRRLGRHDEALSAHLDALPALGVVGDHGGLQGCLFGIGLCVGAIAARGERGTADPVALAFIELSLAVCDAFHVGNDSAQAEILAARWAARLGQGDDARAWLARAEALVEHGASDFDQACFLRSRAELRLRGIVPGDARHDALSAIRLFELAGDQSAADELRRAIQDTAAIAAIRR